MPRSKDTAAVLKVVKEIFDERIPFNGVLGISVEHISTDEASFRLPMRADLVGNFMRGNLHGGAISATLDVTGGLVAFLGVLRKMEHRSYQDKLERFSRMGTIDLRVDYLRPGLGEYFISTGFVLRTGSRVAVTRMELKNERDALIAVGTGTYIVS